MKHYTFMTLILLTLLPLSVYAQKITVTQFEENLTDLYARTHPREDLNDEPCAVLRVQTSEAKKLTVECNFAVGEPIYSPGEIIVYVADGTKSITLKSDEYGVLTYALPKKAVKQKVYQLKVKLEVSEAKRRRMLVMLDGAWHPDQPSFGAMVGFVATHGAYVRFRSNFKSASSDYECNASGQLTSGGTGTPFYKPGVNNNSRLSITGGYLYRVIPQLYAYAGAGFGQRINTWETVEGKLVKNTEHSHSGAALEIGVVGRYKMFGVSLGVQTINFKYAEPSFGIGVFF